MKKLLAASFLSLGLSLSVLAADVVPVNTKGEQTLSQYAGSSTCMITSSTGTAAVLCASGSGIILQVIASSTPAADYITFRDTTIANTSQSELARIAHSELPAVFIYPRFNKGLSANVSAVPGPGATGAWTIIYTKDVR